MDLFFIDESEIATEKTHKPKKTLKLVEQDIFLNEHLIESGTKFEVEE
jgi:hypothetical protein